MVQDETMRVNYRNFRGLLECPDKMKFDGLSTSGRGLRRWAELDAFVSALVKDCHNFDAALAAVRAVLDGELAEYVKNGYPAEFSAPWQAEATVEFDYKLFARFIRDYLSSLNIESAESKIYSRRIEFAEPVKGTDGTEIPSVELTQRVLVLRHDGVVEGIVVEFKNSYGISNSNKTRKKENKVENSPQLLIPLLGLMNDYPGEAIAVSICFLQVKDDKNFEVSQNFVYSSIPGRGSKDDNLFMLYAKEGGYTDAGGALVVDEITKRIDEVVEVLRANAEDEVNCKMCPHKAVCHQQEIDAQYLDAVLRDHPRHELNRNYSADQQAVLEYVSEKMGRGEPVKQAIIAPPGSGKTHTMVGVAANLLDAKIDAKNILFLAFTNKNAEEIRERLRSAYADIPHVSTLNAFAFDLLQSNGEVYYGFKPVVCGDRQAFQLMLNVLADAGKAIEGISYGSLSYGATQNNEIAKLLGHYTMWKKQGRSYLEGLAELKKATASSSRRGTDAPSVGIDVDGYIEVFEEFEQRLKTGHMITLDEQIPDCLDMLKGHPEILAAVNAQYRYILVDEFQDMDGNSADLCFLMGDAVNLVVVGDDDQSIYGSLRGGDPVYLLGFADRYNRVGGAYSVLHDNFRSDGYIVELANRFMAGAGFARIDKGMVSHRPAANKPVLVELEAGRKNNAYSAQFARSLKEWVKANPVPDIGQVCVLCTTNDRLLDVRRALAAEGVSSHLNRMLLREDPVFLDIMAALSMIYYGARDNRTSNLLLRVGIANTGKRFTDLCKLKGTIYDSLLAATGLPAVDSDTNIDFYNSFDPSSEEERLWNTSYGDLSWAAYWLYIVSKMWTAVDRGEDMNDLLDIYAREYGMGDHVVLMEITDMIVKNPAFEEPKRFLKEMEDIVKYADPARLDSEYANSVVLSTAHDSKGLEWGHVFIYDLGTFNPKENRNGEVDPADEAERRRLLYVAITRAKTTLNMFVEKPKPLSTLKGFAAEIKKYLSEL